MMAERVACIACKSLVVKLLGRNRWGQESR
jgi:hypothetical protein